jgi:hypothetical protein
MIEIMRSGTAGIPPEFPADLVAHQQVCPQCGSLVPEWIENSRALKQMKEEGDVIERAAAGDPSILKKSVADGIALFSLPQQEGGVGLMVIVGEQSPFDVRSVARITKTQFDEYR